MKFPVLLSVLSALFCCAGWGELKFESRLVTVHATADAEKAQVDFQFANRGEKDVIISHINPDCDCLTVQASGGTILPDDSIRYRPGEAGTIRSVFKVGNSSGTVDQVVAIWLKGDPRDKPSIRLTARILVPELVKLEPKTLKWEVGSEPEPQVLTVTMNHDRPIAVTRMACTSKSFRAELRTVEAGKKYEVVVTPIDTETPGIGVVQIETDCEVEKQSGQQAFVMIQRPQ